MSVVETQDAGLDFFFSMIKWVFTDFLINIKVLGFPVLYIFIAIVLVGLVMFGMLNFSTSNLGSNASRYDSEKLHQKRQAERRAYYESRRRRR